MNATQRQYLFGLIFLAIGVYYITRQSFIEAPLYIVGGFAFIVNALTIEPRLAKYKKSLSIISWILIIATGLLLLYLAQFYWF